MVSMSEVIKLIQSTIPNDKITKGNIIKFRNAYDVLNLSFFERVNYSDVYSLANRMLDMKSKSRPTFTAMAQRLDDLYTGKTKPAGCIEFKRVICEE